MLEHYLSLNAEAMFTENMVLAFFSACAGFSLFPGGWILPWLGAAVVFVLPVTVPLNYLRREYLTDIYTLHSRVSAFSGIESCSETCILK